MNDFSTNLLEKLHAEHRTHVRHIEALRSGVLGTINTLGGALLAFSAADGVARREWPIGPVIIALGLFGVFSAKLHEKLRLEMKLANAALLWWAETPRAIIALHEQVRANHVARHPITSRIKMIALWLALAAILTIAGAALLVAALS